jgi:uncharacterized protein (DUF58 family)
MWRWRHRNDAAVSTTSDSLGAGLLSADEQARIKRIEVRTRRLAKSALGGDYRSVFRGTGIEFSEAREYVPGDDVRFIDWNVTARMSTPWVKEFVEERELSIVCAVDLSASQLVAQREDGRIGAAAELIALLGFAAVQHDDRVGLLTFGGAIEHFVPPRHGVNHTLRLIRDVLHHPDPASGTSLATAAEYLARVLRRRSVVFLISDFFDDDYADALRALSRRHDVIALVLVDSADLELPDLGIVRFAPAEGGPPRVLDSGSTAVRQQYAEAAQARVASRQRLLAFADVDEVELHVDRDLVAPIARYFRLRARRR